MAKNHAIPKARETLGSGRERARLAIETDQMLACRAFEQQFCMAAGADRRIDDDRGPIGEHQFADFVPHHRLVKPSGHLVRRAAHRCFYRLSFRLNSGSLNLSAAAARTCSKIALSQS